MRRLRRETSGAQAALAVGEVHEALLRAELRQSETVESYAARLAGAARDLDAVRGAAGVRGATVSDWGGWSEEEIGDATAPAARCSRAAAQ